MSIPAWLRRQARPPSPSESSRSTGGRCPSRRPASSPDSFELATARAGVGVRHAAFRPGRGLRPVLVSALLALPLLAGLSTGAQAQLVSNTGQARADRAGAETATAFTTGSHSAGYTISSVAIVLGETTSRGTVVRIREGGGTNPGDVVATLNNPASFRAESLNTFTAPANTILAANTTYFLVVNDGRATSPNVNVRIIRTNSDSQTGATGWTIANGSRYRFTATSWEGRSGVAMFAIRGTAVSVNAAPTVAIQIPNQSATVGTAFTYQFPANTFADADSDPLTYTAEESDGTALPSWLAFNAGTRTFTGTPQSGDTGTVTVRVTADDNNGGTVFDDFDIAVSAADTPVTGSLTVPSALTVAEGGAQPTLSFTGTLTGSPGNTAGVAFSGTSGTATVGQCSTVGNDVIVTGTWNVQAGTDPSITLTQIAHFDVCDDSVDEPAETFTLTLTAGNDLFDASQSHCTSARVCNIEVTIQASDNAANAAPTVANPIPDRTARVGRAFRYQFPMNTFADTDSGDVLVYASARRPG
ncbi:MAG: hypothetical protein F4X42_03700 [Rhodospirillaceae bacterium]|nr:hypothetical protein [Rhodospirillaceae bacterium]MYB12347.1 hypothetical protein [Rhodospirillaceae bacterium]